MEGVSEYEQDMLKKQTIDDIRGKISDLRTQNVSAYDPAGFESLDTYDLPLSYFQSPHLTTMQTRNIAHCHNRSLRPRNLSHHNSQPPLR